MTITENHVFFLLVIEKISSFHCDMTFFFLKQHNCLNPISLTDYLLPEFHKARRQALREKMPDNSVAVFFSNPVRNRANDVQYMYHQDPDFHYLTRHREPHAVLLLFKQPQDIDGVSTNEMIFIRAHDSLRELYDGARLGEEGVIDQSCTANYGGNREIDGGAKSI